MDDIPVQIIDIENTQETFNPYDFPLAFLPNQPQPYQPGNEAWDEDFITISNQIASPFSPSTISSLVGIKLLPGAVIASSMHLKIGVPLSGSVPQSQVSEQYLSDYCAGLTTVQYSANQFSAKAFDLSSVPPELLDPYLESTSGVEKPVELFPNPASGVVHINSNVDPITEVEIRDLSGRILLHFFYKDGNPRKVDLDINKLTNGVYLVLTRCNALEVTNRLVIAH